VRAFIEVHAGQRRQLGYFATKLGEGIYNLIVSRGLFTSFLLTLPLLIRAQDAKPPETPQQVQEPPEEDNSFKPRTYDFNPLQASRSITAGNFYFDKKNYPAAKNRYTDATLYDPGNGEAFEKLGEAQEKLRNFPAALTAYQKFFELEPASKEIAVIKKRMEKWPASARPRDDLNAAGPKK
jgi:tetratricopeptide (TPR) repeat protein